MTHSVNTRGASGLNFDMTLYHTGTKRHVLRNFNFKRGGCHKNRTFLRVEPEQDEWDLFNCHINAKRLPIIY